MNPANTNSSLNPATSSSALQQQHATVTASIPSAPWRCSNDVLRRLFPPSCLQSLLSFLVGVGYTRADLIVDADNEEYKELIEKTAVVDLSLLSQEYGHVPVTQPSTAPASAVAFGSGSSSANASSSSAAFFAGDFISLNSWSGVQACPTAAMSRSRAATATNRGAASASSASAAASSPVPMPPPVHPKSDGMRTIILNAIERLIRKGPNISVLNQGYAKLDNHRYRTGISDRYIHPVETNTLVTFLQSAPWCLLLARTGYNDELLLWMMMNTALFVALENKCCVQLTGPAIAKLSKAIGLAKASMASSSSSSSGSSTHNNSNLPQPQSKSNNATLNQAPPPAMIRSSSTNGSSSNHTARTAAPSSAALAAAASSSSSAKPNPTPLHASGIASTASKSSIHLSHPYSVPFTSPLPRSSMFYRAPSRSEIGLPGNHVFNLCAPNESGVKRMLALIYHLPTSSSTPSATAVPTSSPNRASSAALKPSVPTFTSVAQIPTPAPFAGQLTRSASNPSISPSRVPSASAAISTAKQPINLWARTRAPQLPPPPQPVPMSTSTAMDDGVVSALAFLDPLDSTAKPSHHKVTSAAHSSTAATVAPSSGSNKKSSSSKKRVRVKTDSRKEKRRLTLLSRAEKARGDQMNDVAPSVAAAAIAAAASAPPANHPSSSNSNPKAGIPLILPLPPPLPLQPLPLRLRPLVPLLTSMLKRHRKFAYGRWLKECATWTLPRGVSLPKQIVPTASVKQRTSTEAEPIAAAAAAAADVSMEDDGGIRPMSIDSEPPSSLPLPPPSVPAHSSPSAGAVSLSANSSNSHGSFPSLSSSSSANSISPLKSQPGTQSSKGSTPSSQGKSLSQSSRHTPLSAGALPNSNVKSQASAAANVSSPALSANSNCSNPLERNLFLTQAFDEEEEAGEGEHKKSALLFSTPVDPTPPPSNSLLNCSHLSAASVPSPASISLSFQAPSLAPNGGAGATSTSSCNVSQSSLQRLASPASASASSAAASAHSTPASHASAIAFLRQLQSSTPIDPSPSPSLLALDHLPTNRPVHPTHVSIGLDPIPFSFDSNASSVSASGSGAASASGASSSQLSKSAWKRLRQQRKRKVIMPSSKVPLPLHPSSHKPLQSSSSVTRRMKQTQTPSRRAQKSREGAEMLRRNLASGGATAVVPFIPLAELPLETLMSMSSTSSQVCRFLSKSLTSILALGLFGSLRNRAHFLRNAARFVRMRRFETMSGMALMEGMKLSEVGWVQPKARLMARMGMGPCMGTMAAKGSNPLRTAPVGVTMPPVPNPRKRKLQSILPTANTTVDPNSASAAPSSALISASSSSMSMAMPLVPAPAAPKKHGPRRRGKNRRGVRPPHKVTRPKPTVTAASASAPSISEEPTSKRARLVASSAAAAASSSVSKSIKHSSHKIRVPASFHRSQLRLLHTLLRFLFTDFILPLLRSNFYITDSEGSKHRLLYYRREVWNEIVRKGMERMTLPSVSVSMAGSGAGAGAAGMEEGMFTRVDRAVTMEYLEKRLQGLTSQVNAPHNGPPQSSASSSMAAAATPTLPSLQAPLPAMTSSSTPAGFGLGVAKLRLRPRRNGSVRPIVNMARGGVLRWSENVRNPVLTYPPINSILRNLFDVIRYEKDESVSVGSVGVTKHLSASSTTSSASAAAASSNPNSSSSTAPVSSVPSSSSSSSSAAAASKKKQNDIMGCSVFGINAIYSKMRSFALQWKALKPINVSHSALNLNPFSQTPKQKSKKKKSASSGRAPLYAVCVDIKSCFDTINRVKLLSILQSLLLQPSYSASRYTSLLPLFGSIRVKYLRSVSPSVCINMFVEECVRRARLQRHVVYTDLVTRRFLDRSTLLRTFAEHIYQNFVVLAGKLYHQNDGIPQGSILSSLLCCIYLAHLEKKALIPQLIKTGKESLRKDTPGSSTSASSSMGALMNRSKSNPNSADAKDKIVQASSASATVSAATNTSLVKSASMMVARKRIRNEPEPTSMIDSAEESTSSVNKRLKLAASEQVHPTSSTAIPTAVPQSAAVAASSVAAAAAAPAASTSSSSSSSSSAAAAAPVSRFHPIHLLLRQMDDFLYITSSLPAARKFLEIMCRGFKEEYGMEINQSKTKVWFGEEQEGEGKKKNGEDGAMEDILVEEEHKDNAPSAAAAASSSSSAPPSVDPAPAAVVSRVMCWNGYLIDIPTLAISADYSRLKSDQAERANKSKSKDKQPASSSSLPVPVPDRSSLADSLTIDFSRHPGTGLARSFRRFLHPKCHPLLLDASMHSVQTVVTNLYENFVLSCMKLLTQSNELRQSHASSSPSHSNAAKVNQWFMLQTLLDGVEYTLQLIHARFSHHKSKVGVGKCAPRFPLSNIQVRFLALHAFECVVGQKQTRWRLIHTILRRMLQRKNEWWLLKFEKGIIGGAKDSASVTAARPVDPQQAQHMDIDQAVDPSTSAASSSSASSAAAAAAAPAPAPSSSPSSSADSSPPRSASQLAWMDCIHRGLYALFQQLQSAATPNSAQLGTVSKPKSLNVDATQAQVESAVIPPADMDLGEFSSVLPASSSARSAHKRSLTTTDASSAAAEATDSSSRPFTSKRSKLSDTAPSPSALATAVTLVQPTDATAAAAVLDAAPTANIASDPSSSPCLCSLIHVPSSTPALTAADRSHLHSLRVMLPELEASAHRLMQQIRF